MGSSYVARAGRRQRFRGRKKASRPSGRQADVTVFFWWREKSNRQEKAVLQKNKEFFSPLKAFFSPHKAHRKKEGRIGYCRMRSRNY